MFRKIGVAILYVVTIGYILLIALPSIYCLRTGCRGPAELDAFMPAFLCTPLGAIATALSLRDAIQRIRKKQSPWLFWPLAIVFSIVLIAVVLFVVWMIYHTVVRR
jgi:hypothetical protein